MTSDTLPGACRLTLVFFCLLFFAAAASTKAEDNYSFDLEEFEKKPLEWGGYFELKWEHIYLNQNGALYLTEYSKEPRESLDRISAALQFKGSYQKEELTFNWLFLTSAQEDQERYQDGFDTFEAYASVKPSPLATFNVGKKPYKWGKGYAWNPVAVIDRPKDPANPEEALEGFTGIELDLIKSFSADLKTAALTTVFLPVTDNVNEDFGKTGDNFAAKLYLLYLDTDIDLIWFDGESRPASYGFDFAKNLTTNFEIHGEVLYTPEQKRRVLAQDGTLELDNRVDTRYLLGLRFLTENDITTILELYHNENGFTEAEMDRFFQLVYDAADAYSDTGDTDLLDKADNLAKSGYGKPQTSRNYLYLKVSQKEPFDLLYTTPGITLILNLEDESYSLSPEITYTGITNWELRLRLTYIEGNRFTEYGEKQNEGKSELRIRYYF